MNEYIISIAIPVYNRERFLRRLLNSIIKDIDADVEVFVSDNASTDNTELMMHAEFPGITYYKNNENIGPDGNFLECYRKAKGKYVWLVGSDDIISTGSIKRIVSFIKNNIDKNLPLIFLNHNFFEGKYKGLDNCKESYLDIREEDRILHSKKELIDYAGNQLTFMSAFMLNKSHVDKVDNPEVFLNTNFIQTYFALEVSKDYCDFGIIFYPCVSQDLTPENSSTNNNYSKQLHIFGSCMYDVLVKYGEKVGFDKKQIRKKYIRGMLKKTISLLLKAKANDDKDGIKVFWHEVFPNMRTYSICWLTVIPIALIPSWVAKSYYKIKGLAN